MFARTPAVALFTVADAGLVAVAFYLNGASVACH